MRPADFFRIAGYAWGYEPVRLTTDLDELRDAIRSADLVVGHNIHAFDLSAVFGADSTEPLTMARAGRIFDTWTHATLAMPAPPLYTNRDGKQRFASSPEQAMVWFSLDNIAFQLGVPGKSASLKAIAKRYDGDFGAIPLDDPEFRQYLTDDVESARAVARALLRREPLSDYSRREQLNAAIDAQNTRNGWRLDLPAVHRRIAEIEQTKADTLAMLADKFGLPTDGKAPLRTKAGKAAVLAALASVGISEDDLPRTPAGAPSLGRLDESIEAPNDEAAALCQSLALLGGLRPLAQHAMDHLHSDGKVHPSITTLQRSGRKSTTKPGLTVWNSRGAGAIEKAYFIPNSPDEVLVEFDYSQADARIVAAYSGDENFADRFAEGADAHMITAYAVWGKETVDADPAHYRQIAKALGHAYAYRAGPSTLARTAKQPYRIAEQFVEAMQRQYREVTRWQERVTEEGKSGWVTNAWGRKMLVERNREFTQAPALYGQSGTREIVVDALIRMPDEILTMLVAQVHDALIFSIPRDRADEISATIRECMETTWQPPDGTGQPIHFPVGQGPYAANWHDASHNG
jgi:DNA polymerase-1